MGSAAVRVRHVVPTDRERTQALLKRVHSEGPQQVPAADTGRTPRARHMHELRRASIPAAAAYVREVSGVRQGAQATVAEEVLRQSE